MSVKNRILSMILAVAMFLSVMSILPPVDAWAAAGDAPEVALGDPVIGDNYVTIKGYVTKNGGVKITKYGFGYKINGGSWVWDLTEKTIASYVTFSCRIDDLEPGDEVYYVVLAENQYGEGKVYNTIYVPEEEEPEIELDAPSITSPDEDDTFYAGEDITFKWSSVSDAEGFEWELYETSAHYVDKLIDDGSITGTTSAKRRKTIDGDTFKVGYSYKFKVRAYCDDVYSGWDSIYIYIDASPEPTVDPEELFFDAAGGKDYIDLTSSHDWEASVSVNWIDLSDYDGTGDEEITVYVDENTGEHRTGVITITSDVGSIKIIVQQDKGIAPELDIDRTAISASSKAGTYNFKVLGNVIGWKITDNVDWLRVSPSSGSEEEWVQVIIDANESTQSRTATITVSGAGITCAVTVTQEGRTAMVGDINGDGVITNKDRFILNRYLAGMDGYTDIDLTVADINGDGKVNQADADYLTNHLAGIKGYESFPEKDAPCLHANCDAIYAGKTVFINNTIKNDGVHSYYHMWHYVCKDCGEDLGIFQGNDDAIKGASEKNIACTYNSDGVCSCGSIDTTGYASWTAKNITGEQISVYDTPYSTDGSYGKIFVNESVKVLGSKAGRYLIEYTVTSTNAKKQGYVNANFLASASNYRIEFGFETITLPVSGRTVLLIPKDGYAAYTLYDGETALSVDTAKLKINFEDPAACNYGATTITGKVGGFGTLSVYYIVNGTKYYLQCPDYYIVADSSAVYTSGNVNTFSDAEKEYISMALDMYFSQDDIDVPYELYWSVGENLALCIEELDKILASLISVESPTTQDYAGVLAAFIKKYTQAQENGTTVDELNDIAIAESLWKIIKFVDSAKSVPGDVKTIVAGIQSLCASGVETPEQLKELFTLTYNLITNNAFVRWAQSSNELSALLSKISKAGVSVKSLANKLEAIISNSKFWSKALGILNVAWGAKDAIEHIVVFSITTFGNWQRHRDCLSMMLTAIDSIPTENRTKNYKVLRGAVVELLDKYDEEFWDRLNNNLKTLASSTIVWGTKLLVAYACPGAMAVLATAQFFVGLSNVREEADMIRMRQFYLIMDQAIFDKFKDLYDEGDTFSSIYLTADDLVKMFLNMAIYTNELAQNISEYTDADKAVYEKNIEKIKKKFAIYLD